MVLPLKLAKLAGLFVLTFAFTIKLMQWMGIGCASSLCRQNGFPYGLQLTLALLLLAAVGGIFRALLSPKGCERPPFQFFTAIAVGFTVLTASIYARSLVNHLIAPLPITRWEFFALLCLAFVAAWSKQSFVFKGESPENSRASLLVGCAIVLALCILFADRELPRLMSLSSDPDQHAFFGKQITRFGAIPYEQGAWGPQAFNYPAGSGVLLYIMVLLGGMEAMDALVTLPVLLTFLSALMLVEQLTHEMKSEMHKAVLQLSAVALVAGALMFPLFMEYVHGEGSARVMSILFSALFVVVIAPELNKPTPPTRGVIVMAGLVLFVLMVLSPANALMPFVMLASILVYELLNGRFKPGLMLVLLAGSALAFLDPYYQRLAGITSGVKAETLIMADRFELLGLRDIAARTWAYYVGKGDQFVHEMAVLLVESGTPLFVTLITVFGVGLIAVAPRGTLTTKKLAGATAFLVILFLVYGFAFSFLNDPRFHLLGPYFFFNISQYKALLLIAVVTLLIKKPLDLKLPVWVAIALAGVLIWPVKTLVRDNQKMFLDPRRGYCGALGCLPNDDAKLLRQFEELTLSGALARQDGATSRVLLPNFVSPSEIETWIIPSGSARVLPQYEVLPAAFYYFQGEAEYGTASYGARVCLQFDRPWLKSQRIDYLYLPSEREAACVFGMEKLIETEKVVLKEGNAYLLQLLH